MKTRSHRAQDTEAMDRLLLKRIAHGDRDALATLYYNYHERLCVFLYRLTQRAEIIDEVINECFWVVWQKASEFRQASPVSTSIMGIAYLAGLKALHRRDAELVDADDVTQDLVPSPNCGKVGELRDRITDRLACLTSDQRLVFELVYGEGHSLDDIATITGIPLGTVKARLCQAKTNLRIVLPLLPFD
jgi:RNA polymerase sigma-70 factor (ECF subfamily)